MLPSHSPEDSDGFRASSVVWRPPCPPVFCSSSSSTKHCCITCSHCVFNSYNTCNCMLHAFLLVTAAATSAAHLHVACSPSCQLQQDCSYYAGEGPTSRTQFSKTPQAHRDSAESLPLAAAYHKNALSTMSSRPLHCMCLCILCPSKACLTLCWLHQHQQMCRCQCAQQQHQS